MLYRLIETWLLRMPLPTGVGRWGVLLMAVLVTAAAAGLGIPKLSVGPLGEVFDSRGAGEQRYADYRQLFNSDHEAIVLIDTGEGGKQSVVAEQAAFALGESLEQERKIAAVYWGLNPTAVSPKLIRTLPLDEFNSQVSKLAQLRPLLTSLTPTALLQAGMAEAMRAGMSQADAIAGVGKEGGNETSALTEGAEVFVGLMEALTQRMELPADEPMDLWSALQAAAQVPDWELLRTASGRLLVIRVEMLDGVDGLPGYQGSLAALRRQVEATRLRFEEVEIGITGYEPTRREAEAVIRGASRRAAGGAVFGLMLLTGFAWRSLWLPVVTVILPGVAVTCTLGVVGWLYGSINALALIGVGVAGLVALFGGLLLAGVWARGEDRRAAIAAAGPVLAIGGLVVSAVGGWFVMGGQAAMGWGGAGGETLGLAGLRDAGWIAIVGAAVAFGVVVMLGPALLGIQRTPGATKREARGELARVVASAAERRPAVAWGAAGLMILTVAVTARWTSSTTDTSSFLPTAIEGAQWQQRALVQGGEWGLPLSYLAEGMGEATALTGRLRALPEVAEVTGIGRLIPPDTAVKRERLNELDEMIGTSARQAAEADEKDFHGSDLSLATAEVSLVNQVRLVRAGLEFLPESVKHELGDLHAAMKTSADVFLQTASQLDAENQAARLAALNQDYAAARRQAGLLVVGLLDPADLTFEDLSTAHGLFDSWIHQTHDATTGETRTLYRLKIYPEAGRHGWPTGVELAAFRDAVQSLDIEPTGTLDRLLVRGRSMSQSAKGLVGLMSFALLLVLLVSGMRWRAWLGGALALASSAVVLLAAVGWLGQPMTALGWSVWPLIGVVGVLWVVACSLGKGRHDPRGAVSQAAGGEAFGLMLATGFIVAAGLRSAGAPGLTATAVAACLAVGLMGLWVLLLVPGPRKRSEG